MPDTVPVLVPQTNPNDELAVLVCWHVESGARVRAGQPIATLETTKATFDVDAPHDGFAFYEHEPNSLVEVGAALAYISSEDEAPLRGAAPESRAGAPEARRFTRKALKLMQAHGLAESDFPGEGRVDTEQVERRVRARSKKAGGAAASRGAEGEPLEQSPSKIIEAQTLAEVYRQVVPSMVAVALSCERVEERLRRVGRETAPISLLELALYEAARLLAAWPELNGFYADGRAWRHPTVSIGFAVNLGRSLRVPVVKDAGSLSHRQTMTAVRDLSLRYARNELQIDDLTGGTFTITDLSQYGVVHFVPVLNQRQSAILGICAESPGSGTRELVLSFDHRMSDGMRAAQFLSELRDRLQQGEQ